MLTLPENLKRTYHKAFFELLQSIVLRIVQTGLERNVTEAGNTHHPPQIQRIQEQLRSDVI